MDILKIWRFLLDIFFPPLCISCGQYMEGRREKVICAACFNSIHILSAVSQPTVNIRIAATGLYGDRPLKEIIHGLKYDRLLDLQEHIKLVVKKYLALSSLAASLNPEETVIVPIPLYRKKKQKRGFNQAELIADILGQELNAPVNAKILKRIKETKPQASMKNNLARAENIKDSFAVLPSESLKDKEVVLVDDVYTSGATVNEALKELRKLGARKFLIFVLAKT